MSQKGKKGTPGAPIKLTNELIHRITQYIMMGAYVETAAASCGVNKTTFYAWLHKGATAQSGLCKALNNAVTKALADSELRDLAGIDRACNGGNERAIKLKDEEGNYVFDKNGQHVYLDPLRPDWKANAWKLERRFPKKWGSRQTLEHIGSEGGPIQHSELTPEQLEAELKRLREANETDE